MTVEDAGGDGRLDAEEGVVLRRQVVGLLQVPGTVVTPQGTLEVLAHLDRGAGLCHITWVCLFESGGLCEKMCWVVHLSCRF